MMIKLGTCRQAKPTLKQVSNNLQTILILTTIFFGSWSSAKPAYAQLSDCIGPEETMETTHFHTEGGESVTIDFWNPTEQAFLTEYHHMFLSQCMNMPAEYISSLDSENTVYDRQSYQNIIDRAERVCRGETGGYGTNWDQFLTELRSFAALCRQPNM